MSAYTDFNISTVYLVHMLTISTTLMLQSLIYLKKNKLRKNIALKSKNVKNIM